MGDKNTTGMMRCHRLLLSILHCCCFLTLGGSAPTGKVGWQSAITVPEDFPIGSLVTDLNILWPGNGHKSSEYILLSGDDYRRFSIGESDGKIWLKNPLDFQVQSIYELRIQATEKSTLPDVRKSYQNLTVNVYDVPDYPPVYNLSCETPIRTGSEQLFAVTLLGSSLTSADFPLAGSLPENVSSSDYRSALIGTLNNNCGVQVTFAPSRKLETAAVFSVLNTYPLSNLSCPSNHEDIEGKFFFINRNKDNEEMMTFLDLEKNNLLKESWINDTKTKYFVYFDTIVEQPSVAYTCAINDIIRYHSMALDVTLHFSFTILGCGLGRYGPLCDQVCLCKNGARCHGYNGACLCRPGWAGIACDIPVPAVVITTSQSPDTINIGDRVNLSCTTVHVNITSLTWQYTPLPGREPRTGRYVQLKSVGNIITLPSVHEDNNGFYYCVVNTTDGQILKTELLLNASTCLPNYHGEFCNKTCDCNNEEICDRKEGCICLPGWTGANCASLCPEGYYGQGCARLCTCVHAGKCDPTDGTCQCPTGWHGSRCEQPCLQGRYGPGCSYQCKCEDNATCNVLNGTCENNRNMLTSNTHANYAWLTVPVVVILLFGVIFYACRETMNRFGLNLCRKNNKQEQLIQDNLEDTTKMLLPWERDEKHLKVIRMIGQGTFGHVVLAQLKRPGEPPVLVAVKTLQTGTHSTMCHKDFYREADILTSLYNSSDHMVDNQKRMHPNIVGLYGVITQSDPKRILLEYAPRGDLLHHLRRNRSTPGASSVDFLGLAVHVARGLQELERLKIVHRDLAARNVLVTEHNVAKIADFGLARDVYTNTDYVHVNQGDAGADLLPLKWMSLESLRDGVYTSYSDVWSYGVLLWEIITFGEEPHYPNMLRPDCRQLVNLLKLGTRLERPDKCPVVLYRLMSRCWEAEASQRPLAAELEAALTAILPRQERHPMNRNVHRNINGVERETAL